MGKDKSQGQPNHEQFTQPGSVDPEEQEAPPMMVTLTKDALIELIREARRDPAREAEVEKEAARIQRRRDQMLNIARHDEKAKAARQSMCGHRKPNGEETSGGQEFSDGKVRIFCLRCQKVLRTYWSPEVARGMAIERKMAELGITDDDVKQAMEIEGDGYNDDDLNPDPFAMPRGAGRAVVTTET